MAGLRDLAIRILISGEDQTGPAVRSVNAGTQSIITGVKSLETAAKRILGITLFVGLAKEAISLSDSYRTLEARLKLVTDGTEQFNTAQSTLFAISQRTRTGLDDTYTIYGKLATAIKVLGGTQEQAFATTETLNKAIALTSQGAAQDSAAILQFSQALGLGMLRGQDLNSVMSMAPGLAKALADGLGVPVAKLREMAEAGQLTSDKLINALGNSAGKVAAQFAVLPVTVSGAMTQVNNALLKFIGTSDVANSATSKLSTVLQAVAQNFDAVVSGIITLAEAYAARLVVGMIASTKAFFDNAAAARLAAIAQQEARAAAIALLQTKAQEAAVNVTLKQQLVLEAAQRRALATSVTAETAAIAKLSAAQKALETSQTRLATANTRLAATQETVAVSSGVMSKALGVLGTVTSKLFGAWIAWDIGTTIGEWLRQFESVRIAGTYLAEGFARIQANVEAMLNGMSFSERSAQLKQIHEEFNAIRAAETVASQTAATTTGVSEQQKTEIIKAAALEQQQAFAATQAAIKSLTTTIDAETKTQAAAIQQGLTDRIAAINAADISDTAKESQRVAAKVAAINQTIALDQNAATLKLQLIEQEYAAELVSAKANADRLAAVETSKKEAKLSVYRGIAEFYAGEVAKLSTLYGEENAAFAKSREDIQALARTHEQDLRALDQEGKTEHEKISQDQNDFDAAMNEIRKERKKGEKADLQKINELVAEAKDLAGNLTKTNVEGDLSQYKAKENLNRLYDIEKQALIDNGVAHGKNALAVKSALDEATAGLTSANAKITEMTTALSKEYLLKVGMDASSMSAAQAAIAELTKPETKVITIVTQNAQSAGGPVLGYAGGGYPKRTGILPGFGGGDKIRALLEAGEFIVRKEAVQALGVPVMNLVNAGQLPAIKRAAGGPVNYSMDDELQKIKDEKLAKLIPWLINSQLQLGFGIGNHDWNKSLASEKTRQYLREAAGNDYENYAPKVDEIIRTTDLNKKRVLMAHIMDKPQALAAAGLSMPAVDLQKFASKAVNEATAQTPSSKLLQASKKIVNVQFSTPGSEAVSGEFNENDMDKLFKTLKSAGLRSSVGM
jgi:tape measure domain-containing protein